MLKEADPDGVVVAQVNGNTHAIPASADEAAAKVKKSVERAGHAAREAVEAGAKEAAGQAAAAKSDGERALQDAKAKRGAAKAFKARLKESDAGTQDQRSSGACVVS